MTTSATKLDFAKINDSAAGRWREIIPLLTPLGPEVLTKGKADYPCPLCNGNSVLWPASDAERSGRIACRNCTNNKPTGDGIATVPTFGGKSMGDAARAVALCLGINGQTHSSAEPDLIAEVCRNKHMPLEAFKQFGPITSRSSTR